jgi:glutamate decarboxylase
VLRIVVRNGFTHDLADLLLGDVGRVLHQLRAQTAPQRDRSSAAFAHGAGSHMAEKSPTPERRTPEPWSVVSR